MTYNGRLRKYLDSIWNLSQSLEQEENDMISLISQPRRGSRKVIKIFVISLITGLMNTLASRNDHNGPPDHCSLQIIPNERPAVAVGCGLSSVITY